MIKSIAKTLTFVLLLMVFVQSCKSEPTQQEITLTYLVKDNKLQYNREDGSTFLGVNPKFTVFATVTNTSDYGGVFKLYAEVSSQGDKISFSQEQFIASGETVTISQTKEINHYSFQANLSFDNWGIVAPTKVITIK